MAACNLYDLARVAVVGAPGLGSITLGAAVTSFRTFAEAGVANGQTVRYSVRDGAQREVGRGVYSSTGPTLARTVRSSTNANALVNLSANAIVAIVESSEDILSFAADQTALFTDPERAVACNNIGAVAKVGDTMTGALAISASTASTSTTTGALTVAGGVGVAGAVFTGGNITIQPTTGAAGFIIGSAAAGQAAAINFYDAATFKWQLVKAADNTFNLFDAVKGGNAISFDPIAATLSLNYGTDSTSLTTGAFIVTGGAGFGGSVYCKGLTVKPATGAASLIIGSAAAGQAAAINFYDAATFKWQLLKAADNTFNLFDSALGGNAVSFAPATTLAVGYATASTTSATGALTVAGGTGIGGALFVGGGIVSGTPTGGGKGAGTINAVNVYDDNVLLTCFGTQHAKFGKVNVAQWDAASPTGKHDLAHKFVDMLGDFDPRDPAQYIARMMRDEALPGMPTPQEWKHGALSVGEMNNRLWLAVELLAAAFVTTHQRLQALEHRGR